jgi:hypothetical protein
MARIRKEKNNKYVVDYTIGGKRKRVTFKTKSEAKEYYEEVVRKRTQYSLGSVQFRAMPLKIAINKYYSLVSKNKSKTVVVQEKSTGA